jgi:hypothetical protein
MRKTYSFTSDSVIIAISGYIFLTDQEFVASSSNEEFEPTVRNYAQIDGNPNGTRSKGFGRNYRIQGIRLCKQN